MYEGLIGLEGLGLQGSVWLGGLRVSKGFLD